MDGKRASLPSQHVRSSIQPGGEDGTGRGRRLQEDQLAALPGVPQPRVHTKIFNAQSATPVTTETHRTQHPHCCKATTHVVL